MHDPVSEFIKAYDKARHQEATVVPSGSDKALLRELERKGYIKRRDGDDDDLVGEQILFNGQLGTISKYEGTP